MARIRQGAADALLEQSWAVLGWVRDLREADAERPSVLPGQDVRTLVAHLAAAHQGLAETLQRPAQSRPLTLEDYLQTVPAGTDGTATQASRADSTSTAAELATRLGLAIDRLADALGPDRVLPPVLQTPRGPLTCDDLLASRIIEVVVHSDDLNRSLPDHEPVRLHRGALGRCSRSLVAILAARYPGRSVEVRIPPYAAVQCAIGDPGPTHTRGTPPNVVETDALTFLRLATARTTWAEAMATGQVHASGLRADLTTVLPLL